MRERRIALVARPDDGDAGWLVARLDSLLDRGWDAHLFCDGGDPGRWDAIERLAPEVLSTRVHPPPARLQRSAPRVSLVRALLGGVASRPASALAALAQGGRADRRRLGDRYLDALLIAMRPQLIHFYGVASAARRMALKDVLGCRIVVTAGLGEHMEDDPRLSAADAFLSEGRWGSLDSYLHEEDGDSAPDDEGRPLEIVSAAALDWTQGHEYALLAVRELLDRGVRCRLRIAGNGEYHAALAYTRYKLELEAAVDIGGLRTANRLREALGRADVFLSCAVAHDGSCAVREAQAMGLPIVATDRVGLGPEEIGATGALIPPRDPAAAAAALEALAADPARRRALGQAARAAVIAKRGAGNGHPVDDLYVRTLGRR